MHSKRNKLKTQQTNKQCNQKQKSGQNWLKEADFWERAWGRWQSASVLDTAWSAIPGGTLTGSSSQSVSGSSWMETQIMGQHIMLAEAEASKDRVNTSWNTETEWEHMYLRVRSEGCCHRGAPLCCLCSATSVIRLSSSLMTSSGHTIKTTDSKSMDTWSLQIILKTL